MLRRSFTLLELLVVLVLVALIAAIVVIAWSGVYQKAALEAAINRLESLDQHMRSYARQRGTPCALEFDKTHDRVRKVYDPEDRKSQTWHNLGRGLTLKQIELHDSKSSRRTANVPYDAAGISPTYVLELSTARRQVWLLFAGVGGQLTRLETERESDAALALLKL